MSAVLFSYTTGRELITPGLSGGHGKMHRHHCIFQTCFGAENHLRGRVIRTSITFLVATLPNWQPAVCHICHDIERYTI